MGAAALRSGQLGRATKLLKKSLQLYPLPGVEALIAQAERQQQNASSSSGSASGENNTTNNNNTSRTASAAAASAATTSSSSSTAGTQESTGRSYTQDQVAIVKKVLAAKEGGRGAHYRVLSIEQNASEADIKKAYRKLALKLHRKCSIAKRSLRKRLLYLFILFSLFRFFVYYY